MRCETVSLHSILFQPVYPQIMFSIVTRFGYANAAILHFPFTFCTLVKTPLFSQRCFPIRCYCRQVYLPLPTASRWNQSWIVVKRHATPRRSWGGNGDRWRCNISGLLVCGICLRSITHDKLLTLRPNSSGRRRKNMPRTFLSRAHHQCFYL